MSLFSFNFQRISIYGNLSPFGLPSPKGSSKIGLQKYDFLCVHSNTKLIYLIVLIMVSFDYDDYIMMYYSSFMLVHNNLT